MGYQTIEHANGKVDEGVFPTLDWFREINRSINFDEKTVLDLGCGSGMYSLLAKRAGASEAVGVDESLARCEEFKALFNEYGLPGRVHCLRVEDTGFDKNYDIVLCNMILHWIDDTVGEFRRIADATNNYLVVIFREANDCYQIPLGGKWFTTEGELTTLAASCGFDRINCILLRVQDNNKRILLMIFKRVKRLSIIGRVHKFSAHLHSAEVEALLDVNRLGRFVFGSISIGQDYYITDYINGRDLLGDLPFHPSHGIIRKVILSDTAKNNLRSCIEKVKEAGRELGYTLGDVTRRNIILKDDFPYLVDFDDLLPESRIDPALLELLE